jgi:hypothetical protein
MILSIVERFFGPQVYDYTLLQRLLLSGIKIFFQIIGLKFPVTGIRLCNVVNLVNQILTLANPRISHAKASGIRANFAAKPEPDPGYGK